MSHSDPPTGSPSTAASRAPAAGVSPEAGRESFRAAAWQAAPYGLAIARLEDGRFVEANDEYCRLLGFTRAEVVGRTSLELNLWVEPARREEFVARLLRDGRVDDFEVTGVHGHGTVTSALCDARIALIGNERFIVTTLRDISNQRRMEQAVRDSESLHRRLIEALPDAVIVHDGRVIRFANAAATAIVLLPHSETLVGRSPLDFLHADSRPAAAARMAGVLRGDPVTPFSTLRILRSDGSDVYAESLAVGVTFEGAKGVMVVMRDMTTRLATERALRESEEKFAKAFSASPDAISISRVDNGHFIEVNESFLRYTGYAREEVLGHTSLELNLWPEPEAREHVVGELRRTGRVREFEVTFRMKSGAGLRCTVNAAVTDIAGVPHMIAISRDITERHRAQEALRASERKFATAFMASPDAIAISRLADGKYVEVNEGFERLTGLRRDEILGRTSLELGIWCYPADRERLLALLRQQGHVRDAEVDFRRRDGGLIHGLASAERVELAGEPCLITVVRDVTALKRATEALRESEQRYRVLVESAPEAIVVFDLDTGKIADANANALRLFECTLEELAGLTLADVSPPAQPDGSAIREGTGSRLRAALDGEVPPFTWVHRSRKGRDVPCEVRLVRLPATGRRLVRGSITDISRRLELESQLRQAQKMDSLGRLAGGVAHDFNNILTVVQGHASLLLDRTDLPDGAGDSVRQILQSAEFAAGLTRQLLLVGRKQPPQMRDVDLTETVERMSRLLRRLVGEHLAFEVKPGAGVPPIRGDPGMIDQVLLNLVVNARDAIPASGGRVTLRTGVADVDAAYAQRNPAARAGRCAWLEVADTGVGISHDILPHIFDPFFTTKQAGKGTGLGLATVYSIVQQHHGWIEVESVPSFGARFRVFFPASGAFAKSPAPVPGGPTEARARRAHILAVEDEESVRELLQRMLALLGHDVTAAESGEKALEVWEKHAAEFDLVVADVIMPGGMNGREMVDRMRVKRPDIPAIFVSGYSADVLDPEVLEQPGNHFLGKPFQVEQLGRMLKTALP